MVKDDSKKSQIYNFMEYTSSREVVKDFPRVLGVYEKLLPVLYEFAQYHGVWITIQAVEDAKLLMEMQLEQAKQIYKRKGLKDEPRQTKK